MVWIAVAVVLGLLVIWRLGHLIAGDGSGGEPLPTGGSSTSTASPTPGESTTSHGSVAAIFPGPVNGARLELKVFGLGNTPEACTPADLTSNGATRTVYHHDCADLSGPAATAYFFLVTVTNVSDATVPVELGNFSVARSDGGTLSALDAANATYDRPFVSVDLLPGASAKGWVIFDGSQAFTPSSLSYRDGDQALTVRFRGTWVSS